MYALLTRALAAAVLATTTPSHAAEDFAPCRQFFANGKPPIVAPRPTHRALCYDAFAVLHSGESKTPVFVAEKLNTAAILDADEKRTGRSVADRGLQSTDELHSRDGYRGTFWR